MRSDAEIVRELTRKMKADLLVPDDRIRARVAEGLVTIEGTVTRDSQKSAAESCARSVKGVRGITNKIEVEPDAAPVEAR